MASRVFIKMPELKKNMESATLVSWNKELCERVNVGDILFEVELDKVICEVEAEYDGILNQMFFEEGDQI